jgi:ABC-2 type transport system ATP-binding protein
LLADKTYEVTLFDKKSQGQLLQQLAQFEVVDIKTKSKSLNDVVDFYMKEGNRYDNTQSGISA